MALHSSWVHGNAFRSEWIVDNLQQVQGGRWDGSDGGVPWSDYNGLPRGWGMTYRGKRSYTGGPGGTSSGPYNAATPFMDSEMGYWFHCPIPTPVIVADSRASCVKVFVLWEADPNVLGAAVHVWDGTNRFATLEIANGARGASGINGIDDLVEGSTMFTLPGPHTMFWGLGISIGFWFSEDGNVTLFSAGADFAA